MNVKVFRNYVRLGKNSSEKRNTHKLLRPISIKIQIEG